MEEDVASLSWSIVEAAVEETETFPQWLKPD